MAYKQRRFDLVNSLLSLLPTSYLGFFVTQEGILQVLKMLQRTTLQSLVIIVHAGQESRERERERERVDFACCSHLKL